MTVANPERRGRPRSSSVDGPGPGGIAPNESSRSDNPLAIRPFRLLWSTALVSNVGVWMESVLAGFVMAQLTHVPSLVAAVPVALALPGLVFALPSGAASDATDRRTVLVWSKSLFFLVALGLALLTLSGGLSPFALLVFTAMLGTLGAFSSPAWWGILGDLVPERMLPRALSLDGLQWNVGQMIGPVLGGVILAELGAGTMFALSAVLMACVMSFLLVWKGRSRRRLSTPGEGAAERMFGAMGAGVRYLANAPALQVTCWRTLLFVAPATALSALLPLYATHDLHVGGIGFGLLLSAVGAGSVVGAILLPRLRERLHLDAMIGAASLLSAGATVAVVVLHELVLVAVALGASGFAWILAVTSLNLGSQQAAPAWVRARALGAYLMAFQGSIAFGALAWGGLADGIGVRLALDRGRGFIPAGSHSHKMARAPRRGPTRHAGGCTFASRGRCRT